MNSTDHLNLFCWKSHYCIFDYDPILKFVYKYKFLPSIIAINNRVDRNLIYLFNFDCVTSDKVYNIIIDLKKVAVMSQNLSLYL